MLDNTATTVSIPLQVSSTHSLLQEADRATARQLSLISQDWQGLDIEQRLEPGSAADKE